jgi:hypothetical protein
MTLNYIFGDRGTGKTLLATAIALKENCPIYGNYKIESDKWQLLEPYMLGEEMEGKSMNIIDEAMNWLDCRVRTKLDQYLGYILAQSRKDERDFQLTTQIGGSIDLRFREQADYITLCMRQDDDLKEGNFVYKILKRSNTKPIIITKSIKYDFARDHLFKMYNSYWKIQINPDLRAAAIQDDTMLLEMLDGFIEEYFKEYNGKTINKSIIRDTYLENGISKTFVDRTYDRIKAKKPFSWSK